MRIECSRCGHIYCIMTNPQITKINVCVCGRCGNDLKARAEVGLTMGMNIYPKNKGE